MKKNLPVLDQSMSALDELSINTIRLLAADAVVQANSGHPGMPMGAAAMAYALWQRHLRHDPSDPQWLDRDRFVLSAGHGSMLLYGLLHLTGYDLPLDELKKFRQFGSLTPGHPEAHVTAGVEATTGPLGQGVGNAVGMAIAERFLAARYNRDGHTLFDHYTYVICSDGDLMEGIASEAASLAGHLGLGKLIMLYDDNEISIDGSTDLAFTEDVEARFEAYGWHVEHVEDGNDVDAVDAAIQEAQAEVDLPSLIAVRTHIGYGSPNKQDTHSAHGSPLGEEEVRLTKEFYGWDPDAQFLVPEAAGEHFLTAVERGRVAEAEWSGRLDAYRAAHPELAAELDMVIAGKLPDGWDADVPRFEAAGDAIATRKASSQVIQWAAAQVPQLVSGSADLEPSTLTEIEDGGSVMAGDYSGRNVHYGVREHAMAGIVNGLNLHMVRAFGSTFFNFLDYQKASLRLAALMRLPAIAVYTHDSIGLGEDGPTHQPIEQLAHLRATPFVYAVRPADANETALAWRFALRQEEGPTALVLTRQGLPIIDPELIPDDAIERGAYVLREASDGGEPRLILIGTGSEVSLCLEAAEQLEAGGIPTRVVSMPCVDRFGEQDQAYQDSVLPPACRARVSVEAASTFGWERWVGDAGEIVGMTGFGASAPAKDLFKHFGFTAENVAETGRRVVGRVDAG